MVTALVMGAAIRPGPNYVKETDRRRESGRGPHATAGTAVSAGIGIEIVRYLVTRRVPCYLCARVDCIPQTTYPYKLQKHCGHSLGSHANACDRHEAGNFMFF